MRERKPVITVAAIVRAVAAAFEVHERHVMFRHCGPAEVRARQTVCYLARRLTTLSTVEIGVDLAGLHYSSVGDAVRSIQERISQDEDFALEVSIVESTIIAVARRSLLAKAVDPVAIARRIASDPARNAPGVSYDAVIAMAQRLLGLAEIARAARKLLDQRLKVNADQTADIDAALTASLVSFVDAAGVRTRRSNSPAEEEETIDAA